MSMPLGVIAYSGASNQPDPPKQPKTPKAQKPPKQDKELHKGIGSSHSRRLHHIFARRTPAKGSPTSVAQSASSGTSLSSDKGVPTKSKHVPIVIPYLPELSPVSPTCSPAYKDSEEEPIDNRAKSKVLQSDTSHLPASVKKSLSKSHARHVEIAIPPYPQPPSINSSSPERKGFTVTTNSSDPFTTPTKMAMSAASSRTSTLDSATSAPSPNQLYSRKGSSAQLSVNSSQSSLAGRDDYASASEQDSSHGGHASSTFHGRSPAASNTPNQTPNLSGLMCNVHRTTGTEPPALVGATTTILGDKLYVFGGRRVSRSRPHLTSDLYELDLLSRHWARLETKGDVPSPRYFHSVCALGDNKLVCYGGMSPEPTNPESGPAQNEEPQVTVMSDIHFYDVPTRTWMEVMTAKSPQGRYAHCASILPSSAVFSSANAPVSAIQHNPSGSDPNQGSLGVQIDGTGGAEMIVVGGQDSANRYIEQISVFNLRSLSWTSTQPMSGRSCGAYRSVVTPLTTMSAAKIGAGPGRQDEDDDCEDDADDAESGVSGSPMLVYTNYNFLDVKLELQVRLTDGTLVDKPMQGTVTPPGLRFPSGGIIDNSFVVAGTFLTSSKQEFSLWALDLRTLTWARLDPGSTIFSQGSWNRGVLWNRRNAFCILGNRKRNLVDDYNNRRLNFTNLCIVQLEAFGIYENPRKCAPTSDYVSGSAPMMREINSAEDSIGGRQMSAAAELLGEMCLEARELADMEFLAIDGTRIPVNSRLVARRWGQSFNALLRECASSLDSGTDTATLRPSNASVPPSRNSSITITPSISSSNATTLTANTRHSTSNPVDARALPPNSRPRTLYLPHTVPTLTAFLHFLYTSSLPPMSSGLATPQILCSLLQIARPYKIDGLLEAVIEGLHRILDGRNAAAIFNAAAMGAGGGKDVHFAANASSNNPVHPARTVSLGGFEGLNISSNGSPGNGTSSGRGSNNPLRIDTDVANGSHPGNRGGLRTGLIPGSATSTIDEADDLDVPNSATSLGSHASLASLSGGGAGNGTPGSASTATGANNNGARRSRDEREVWDGGWSAVIGLQKRGLRGLMEGRRARERGTGTPGIGGPGTPSNNVGGMSGSGGSATAAAGGIGLGIA